MKHGYTNNTDHQRGVVVKTYRGPDARTRAVVERHALTSLAALFPVPLVVASGPGALTTAFVKGAHGQDLLKEGRAGSVLRESGRILRDLHTLDASLISHRANADDVIQHGDFGPNNILFDTESFVVLAVRDWEFCSVGPAISDIAWCEWIVRMHHPGAVQQLDAFFVAYGTRPAWADRHAEMLRRCAWLEDFATRWDPSGPGQRVWQERAEEVARWVE